MKLVEKTLLVGTIGIAGLVSATSAANAAVLNGDFSNGLTDWSSGGIANGATGEAVLQTGPNSDDSTDAAGLETYLGLTPGSLNFETPAGAFLQAPVEGSAIWQTLTLNAGDIISFDWSFETDDNFNNDFAFASLANGSTRQLIRLTNAFGDENNSTPYSFTVGTAGAYIFGLGVVDDSDGLDNSIAKFDNINVAAVPTPALLPGLVGIGIATLRKRRRAEAVE